MKIIIKNPAWEIIKELPANLWESLLKQLTEAGVNIHHACTNGMCASCMCFVEKWEEFLDKSFRMDPEFPLWEGEILTCIWWFKKDISQDGEIVLQTIF